MDPLSGLSVACNGIQLFELAFKLVSGAKLVHDSAGGMTVGTQRLEAIANNVNQLSDGIITDKTSPKNLRELGDLSKSVASDLLIALEHLKSKQPSTIGSFKAALQTIWKEKQIQELLGKIQQLQSLIMNSTQFLIMNRQSQVYQEILAIQRTNHDFGATFHKSLIDLRDDIVHRLKQPTEPESIQEINLVNASIQDMSMNQSQCFSKVIAKLDALSNSITQLQQDMKTIKSLQDVLKTFRFRQFDFRYQRVTRANIQTLQWVFEDEIPGVRGDIRLHFREWLEEGDGIFWIRGKAGSGKSTLMKHLCDHPQTIHCLETLAGSQRQGRVVIGKYFFWNPGSPLQKSLEGLLRSLAFDILRLCPDSISSVSGMLQQRRNEIQEAEEELWTCDLLWEILEDVISENSLTCFCFFIDGLDEFCGDSEDLIDSVKRLVSHKNVKVCASSRPWAAFVGEFGEDSTRLMKLEDLNAEDIRRYTHTTLFRNSRFERLARRDASIQGLIKEVATRSDGVFLWVYLVVRSLLEGVKYADSTQFLWKRLNAFPLDLDGFFTQMLNSVPHIYRSKTVTVLQATMMANSSLPAAVYYFISCVEEEELYSLKCKWHDLTQNDAVQLIEDTALRLDGWTKGLLEVVHYEKNCCPNYDLSKVEFLHRTVRDFLAESTSVHDMFEKDSNSAIEVPGLMSHGLLAYIKKHDIHPVLDQAGSVLYGDGWTERQTNVMDMCKLAAEYGLDDYIDRLLLKNPLSQGDAQELYSAMLTRVLVPKRKPTEQVISSKSQLITTKYLTAIGATFKGEEHTWEEFLNGLGLRLSGDEAIFEMLCLLAAAGANFGVSYGKSVFREEVKTLFPRQQALKLLALELK
ncbi:hypothetical protein QQS21_000784 [Conoideocrella luteorostrata]|uniref:NACHT domain-containing protein n=1 Tax=Conoideocrella luteorostrata TaxID=1105319 RepID=A0AAJ0D0Y8_9HYPO|nr:hypothetical protein QQS21_000784 [Conoideocrella luteorostrata]